MNKEYDPSGNPDTGGYVADLGKLGLGNVSELDLASEPFFDGGYLDALSADSDSDLADLPSHKEPIIPEAAEDRSY